VSAQIAVCIPAYRGRFLSQAIDSVLKQTRPVSQLLVVDDCSDDNLEAIVKPYIKNGVIYHRNAKNIGIPDNYNFAIQMVDTDYVMIFGDHDIMEENYLEKCANLMDEDPNVNIVFSGVKAIDEANRVICIYPLEKFPRIFPGAWLAKQLLTNTTSPINLDTLVRRSAISGSEIWFDQKYWWYADIDLWIRLAMKGNVGYVRDHLLLRRSRESNHYLNDKVWQSMIMCDRIRKDRWETVYRNRDMHSRTAKLFYWFRSVRDVIWLRLSEKAKSIPNEMNNPENYVSELIGPFSKVIFPIIDSIPNDFLRKIRSVYNITFQKSAHT
jgi:glycosyltransferase involved in cell wall biosynthesis